MREDFSGQTELADGEIDTDVEKYLTNSEQIASALACEVVMDPRGEVQVAAGILVQALPESEGAGLTDAIRRSLRAGALTRLLAGDGASGTGSGEDALGPLTADELARRVIGGAQVPELGPEAGRDLDVLEVRGVRFHCPCSRERAANALALLGDTDLADLIREDGQAEVTCNFCRERYEFSDVELEQIRRSARHDDVPPS
jgi:molecular chaperone Hsp33